ncbi:MULTISPECIES: helix-turn-helix domain-containing protein [Anaerotruncus]|jgi:transcriptional regulator with XRE-family HTH domain|uniref:helix-turn-helix domain-containing protein n=1 Tax=Anaerotruncus TaxID=244127 RepID=UPI00083480DE|nr:MULTISPECIES: helix-turn-helix transcriptional regulator [Anaerotruncus]RGX55610.1 XRE family transcriptional regulator [Anaerotruncus sp. AF02-27]
MGVDYSAIGRRMKQKRKQAGMTQDNLAEKLSVSVGYISQMERGVTKISLETLSRIAVALDCDITELISGVSLREDNYLHEEIENACHRLGPHQRQLLLEIADVIAKY